MYAFSSSSPLICISWMLIHSVWQGAFVWAAYHLIRTFIRSAAVRCHLGHLALTLFATAQVLTFVHLINAGSVATAPIADTTLAQLAAGEAEAHLLPIPHLETTDQIWRWLAAQERYLPIIAIAWGIGLLVHMTRTLGAYVLLQRHLNTCKAIEQSVCLRFELLARRIGLKRAVRFVESALVSGPATARWLKPVVLVPAAALVSMEPRQLEALILHELAHIKRWDYATNILRTCLSALYFFHPLVRAICTRTADDAEVATDALASQVHGDAADYADSLVNLAELRRLLLLSLSSGGGDLRSRITQLLQRESLPSVSVRSRVSLGGAVVSGFIGILLLAHATTWASNTRATMSWVSGRSLEEVIVKELSEHEPSDTSRDAFAAPLTLAMNELKESGFVTANTAAELTSRLLDGVDPHMMYQQVCSMAEPVNFITIREYPFASFGHGAQRAELVKELVRHARSTPDAHEASRIARATLVFASILTPSDSGSAAAMLLRDASFIAMLNLSADEYHLSRLAVAVNNDRLARVGKLIAIETKKNTHTAAKIARRATDTEIEAFAAELPLLPAIQVVLCGDQMSLDFRRRVVEVLKRDLTRYPPGSIRLLLDHAPPPARPAVSPR